MFGLFKRREKIKVSKKITEKPRDIFSNIKSIENQLVFEISPSKCLGLERNLKKLKARISKDDYPELYI